MKMVKVLAVGLVLFAVSAGASYFFLAPAQQSAEKSEDESKKSADHKEKSPEKDPAHPQPGGPNEHEITKTSQMAVSMPSDKPMTMETILGLAESVRKSEQQIADRERQLLREEQRVNRLFEDLKREQQELLALGESIDSKITAAKQLLEQVRLEKASLPVESKSGNTAQSDTKSAAKSTTSTDTDRLNKVKGWFQSLEPEQAARFIKEFSNTGELEFVCQLLQSMDPKKSAKILAALDDPPLVTSIVSKIGSAKE